MEQRRSRDTEQLVPTEQNGLAGTDGAKGDKGDTDQLVLTEQKV
jgi:hypothetical protein